MVSPINVRAYGVGVGTGVIPAPVIDTRSPNNTDIKYSIGQFWINTEEVSLWYLSSFTSSLGVVTATWISVAGALASLSDTAGTPVYPSSEGANPPSNIQLTNTDGAISIVSDAATNKITFGLTGGSTAIDTLTPDSGAGVIPDGAGAVAITGYPDVNGLKGIKTYNGGVSTLQFSNLRDITPYVVGSNANLSAFTTVQSAIDQAVADGASLATPAVVWITAGKYLEDVTLYPYVHLAGAVDSSVFACEIIGNAVYTGSGQFTATNVSFTTNNASAALSFQGAGVSNVHLQSVDCKATVNGICLECTGANMTLNVTIGTMEAAAGCRTLNISAGDVTIFSSISIYTDTASTISGGVVGIATCNLFDSIDITGGAVVSIFNAAIQSGSLPCINVGLGCSCVGLSSIFISSAVGGDFMIGAGGFIYANIEAGGSAATVNATVSQQGLTSLSGNLSFDGGTTTIDTDGQLIIGMTGDVPQISTLTAGTGIGIVNGAGSITVNSVGGGLTWSVIGASQTLAVNNGYMCTSGGALSLALPATSAVGDTIEVNLDGSTSWTITQPNAGTQIRLGNSETTLGVGGSLASTASGDWVQLTCETANARWMACAKSGNITIV
ncbi:MAG: hypothetical protein KGZ39_00245 [Simkania sp.]|nr:hypothetical protein [Simkania sp.]